VLLSTIFGHQPSLIWPEMTRLFSDPQLKTLADDMVSDPNQLLWLLGRTTRPARPVAQLMKNCESV
jgi:hypothetical protein